MNNGNVESGKERKKNSVRTTNSKNTQVKRQRRDKASTSVGADFGRILFLLPRLGIIVLKIVFSNRRVFLFSHSP